MIRVGRVGALQRLRIPVSSLAGGDTEIMELDISEEAARLTELGA